MGFAWEVRPLWLSFSLDAGKSPLASVWLGALFGFAIEVPLFGAALFAPLPSGSTPGRVSLASVVPFRLSPAPVPGFMPFVAGPWSIASPAPLAPGRTSLGFTVEPLPLWLSFPFAAGKSPLASVCPLIRVGVVVVFPLCELALSCATAIPPATSTIVARYTNFL